MAKMRYIIPLILSILIVGCSGSTEKTEPDQDNSAQFEFKNFNERISFCIGMDHGRASYEVYNGPKTKGKFDNDEILDGMVDYLNDGQLRIDMSEVDSILNLYLTPGGTVDESAVSKKDGSYAIGLTEAQYLIAALASKGIDQEMEVWFLVEGIKAGMKKDEATLTITEARMEVAKYYDEINLKQGQQFLETNGKRDSVLTTASGMQYQIIAQGKGIVPNLTDSVVVHYTGYFIDGRAFESSIPSGQPATFTPLGLIPGWQEALTMMKEGSMYRLYLPHELAYGEKGSGPIPPYSTLVFDIELIKVIRFS